LNHYFSIFILKKTRGFLAFFIFLFFIFLSVLD
jgi:hypothetical protein